MGFGFLRKRWFWYLLKSTIPCLAPLSSARRRPNLTSPKSPRQGWFAKPAHDPDSDSSFALPVDQKTSCVSASPSEQSITPGDHLGNDGDGRDPPFYLSSGEQLVGYDVIAGETITGRWFLSTPYHSQHRIHLRRQEYARIPICSASPLIRSQDPGKNIPPTSCRTWAAATSGREWILLSVSMLSSRCRCYTQASPP